MENTPLISVILPVYNRTEYISQAVDSVISQTYDNWELIIADDASNQETESFLKQYTKIAKVKVTRNLHNIGLFPNLNKAIESSQGEYIVILCSDDFFLSNCLEDSVNLLLKYPQAGLLLSPLIAVDAEGNKLKCKNVEDFSQFASHTPRLFKPSEFLPLLLKSGSINGNITRLFFTKNLHYKVKGFRENWQHAADWEWLYRVATDNHILVINKPLAIIRNHQKQLSLDNFNNISNSLEVIEMVRILLNDRYVSKLDSAKTWALKTMQFHLWYAIKFAIQGEWKEALAIIKAINSVTGLTQTSWAMVQWLPERWRVYQDKKTFVLPKYK